MIGKILTEENKKLLNLIFNYGGYVRVAHIELLYPDIAITNKIMKLEKLKEMGYLTSKRLKTNSKIEPLTFQVTKTTCRLFNNPDSYYRKKHQEEYIYRALLKSYFCFEIHKDLGEYILSEHEQRKQKFIDGKFNQELYPRKYNKNDSFIHFEEFQIDFTNKKGLKLVNDDKVLFTDDKKNVIIVYIDQYYKDVYKQLQFITNRYLDLINDGGEFDINFLIVVDDENRKNKYLDKINKFTSLRVDKSPISTILLKAYKDFYEKYYSKYDADKVELLVSNYSSGKLETDIFNSINKDSTELNDQQKYIIEQIKLKGINYVIERISEMVSTAGNMKDAEPIIRQFFDNLFILEINKHISLEPKKVDKKYNINVYKVGKKIYE